MSTKHKNNFPDPLESDEIKGKNPYGLSVAKAIGQDWFGGGFISGKCDFATRRDKIRENRLFSRGRQDVAGSKKRLEDLNFANLDFTTLNIGGKFIDLIANGMREDLYRIDISAIDRTATIERDDHKKKLQKAMRTKDMLQRTKETLGIDFVPKGFTPKNNEELDIHIGLNFKPKVEIAEELLIKYVKLSNNWKVIKEMIDRDLVENDLGSVRCYTEKTNGVTLKYVDIENYVHSYVKKKDFSDCHYHGEVEQVTISELRRTSGWDDNTLRNIASKYATHNGNETYGVVDFDRVGVNEVLDFKVSVLRFAYKTSKAINYKKKNNKHGGFSMIEKDSAYDPPKRNDYSKVGKILDTWYEGNHIIGTDYLFGYKECEILSRDSLNRALPPFNTMSSNIYDNVLNPISERIQPIAREMQQTHLKIQQIVGQMRPDETEIDIDLLAELESKTGKKLTWEDAIALYNSKGIVLSTRVDMGEEGIKDRPALRVPNHNPSGKLEQLTRVWLFYYNMLRDLTGVNSARDGSQPDDALVGVSQLQLLQSNLSTKGITDASLEITRKTAETISTRLGDVFRWGKDVAQVYKNAVGATNLDVVQSLDNRHLHEFGFAIQLLPTETEIKDFKDSLAIALNEGSIKVDEKIIAERIARMNIKDAEVYLTFRRKKNMEEAEDAEMKRIQATTQGNQQSALTASQAKKEELQFASQLKIGEAKELAIIEVMKKSELNKVDSPVRERGYEVDIFMKQLEMIGRANEKKTLEDRKDDRTKLTATQTSKITEQRSKPFASAIDFTQEDIDGIKQDLFKSA